MAIATEKLGIVDLAFVPLSDEGASDDDMTGASDDGDELDDGEGDLAGDKEEEDDMGDMGVE